MIPHLRKLLRVMVVPKKKYIIDIITNFFSMFEFLIRL